MYKNATDLHSTFLRISFCINTPSNRYNCYMYALYLRMRKIWGDIYTPHFVEFRIT